MNTYNNDVISSGELDSVNRVSLELGILKRKKREILGSKFPDYEALQELQAKIGALQKRKRALREETKEKLKNALNINNRGRQDAGLPQFSAAFCTNSGSRIDAAFGRSRKILVFYYDNGELNRDFEIFRSTASRDTGKLTEKLAGISVLFAKRIAAGDRALLETAGILPLRTRIGDFSAAVEDNEEQIRYFLESSPPKHHAE
ncbi:MAG: hypothetical protein ACYS8W_01250 [Planctomycetota bacterium]|jgi:hypothetical protein